MTRSVIAENVCATQVSGIWYTSSSVMPRSPEPMKRTASLLVMTAFSGTLMITSCVQRLQDVMVLFSHRWLVRDMWCDVTRGPIDDSGWNSFELINFHANASSGAATYSSSTVDLNAGVGDAAAKASLRGIPRSVNEQDGIRKKKSEHATNACTRWQCMVPTRPPSQPN